jgi:hypothetical protein
MAARRCESLLGSPAAAATLQRELRRPRLRPLYHWIRDLYSEEGRLPVMLVHAWV